MTLDQVRQRDAQARATLVALTRNQLTETEARDRLRQIGWSTGTIDKIIGAVRANIIRMED